MRLLVYLLFSLLASLIGTVGADLAARMSVAGTSFEGALAEHFRYWSVGSTLYLFAPFLGVGLVSAAADKWVSGRAAMCMFASATLVLLYFYFSGYEDAQRFLLEEKWTASALAIGFVPIVAGVPVLLLLLIVTGLAVVLRDRKPA